MNILRQFQQIKLFVFDVDGVLTNGQLLLLEDGQMARSMNIKDGYALQLAVKRGYRILVISGGNSEAVRLRLNKLGINDVHLGVKDKVAVFHQYVKEHLFNKDQVLYMGDDLPDLAVIQQAGLPCCPIDADADIKALCHYISPYAGGAGCVRDVIEKVMRLNSQWGEEASIAAQ
jgi:3-deoxy-D-manno-octulosonate 8-phosphate phosphatase (KDO 8-P phosphatase)